MKQQDKHILGCVAGLVLAALALAAFTFIWHLRHPSQPARPDWTLSDLTRRDDSRYDHRRADAFKRAVAQVGRRCDEVTKALMLRPGVWVATCSPGYRYRFTLTESGGHEALQVDSLP